MSEKIYPVLDKYTYQNKHQTDYSYRENEDKTTENRIEPRLPGHETAELLPDWEPVELCRGGLPKNSLAFRVLEGPAVSLADKTGFAVSYSCESEEKVDAALRITFFSSDGQSFMSICPLQAGENTVRFECRRLEFADDIRRVKLDVLSKCNTPMLKVTVTSLRALYALDPLCRLRGQVSFYTADGVSLIQQRDGALEAVFQRDGKLLSPEFPDAGGTVCDMLMPRRNTIFFVLRNDSALETLTVAYRTSLHDDWCEKKMPIRPYSDFTAYYCNLSDTPNCDGRLLQFSLCAPAAGRLVLRRYTFEQEKPIEEPQGNIESCRAAGDGIAISGVLAAGCTAGSLLLYQTDMSDDDDTPNGKELIATIPAAEHFSFPVLPLYSNGITRLSAQFLLLRRGEDEKLQKVCDRFYIENARDFVKNEYAFELPSLTVSCCDYGALGNAVDDDTAAIQAAIDDVARRGGGTVCVPGSEDFYGRRYIVTNLLLRGRVELHLEKGSVLWQSQVPEDYLYRPSYGHDGYIDGINWTHSMHICNLPILHAYNCEYVKVTGGGQIRSMDTGSEEGVDMPAYSIGCPDRIHQITFGFFNVRHINIEGCEVVRANNYHMSFYHCCYLSVIGVKMHEVKCVSGDGVGLGVGTHHAHIANNFFQSNDDGVVLESCYHDPRGILWWTNVHEGSCAVSNVLVEHCYINSAGGKCIAFIPWGTTQRCGELAEMHDIEVRDCCLSSVSPVGAWADNPYWGKMPFDNTDTDDYSPVRAVRIHNNRYLGKCTVYPLQVTNFLSDCGIVSSHTFLNGDFSLGGLANWDRSGRVGTQWEHHRELGLIEDGTLSQGLQLDPGSHTFYAAVRATAKVRLFVKNACTGAEIASIVAGPGQGNFGLAFCVEEEGLYSLGICAHTHTVLESCTLQSDVDATAVRRRKKEQYRARIRETFELMPQTDVVLNEYDGQMYLHTILTDNTAFLTSRAEYEDFDLSVAFRVLCWHRERKSNGYGFLLRAGEDKSGYRLFFNESQKLLVISRVEADGRETMLYRRENFFFTSDDFHHYRILMTGDVLTFWIDNGKYASVRDGGLKKGRIVLLMEDADCMLYDPQLTAK